MSREALRGFVHALEHSASLRRELHACASDSEVVSLARRLDFALEPADLIEEDRVAAMETWFSRSALGIRPPVGTD